LSLGGEWGGGRKGVRMVLEIYNHLHQKNEEALFIQPYGSL